VPSEPAPAELIDHLDAVVWEAEAYPELRFTYVSGAAERILGHPAARLCDEPGFWAAHIHPDDRDTAVRYFKDAVARREHHTFEYRWLAGDDRVVWLRDVVRVHDGDPVVLRGVMIDVTELRAREEQLRLLLDNAEDCVFRVRIGADRGYEYISPAIEKLLGYRPEDFRADPSLVLRIAEPEFRDLVAATFAGDPITRETTSWRHRDGSVRWLETALRVVREAEDGQATAVEGVARDVTERVLAEERSRRAQALFEAAFDQAPLGMGLATLDPERLGEVIAVNDALCAMLGRSREELLATRLDELTHPEDRGRSASLAQRMFAGEIPGFHIEKRYVRPDGSSVWAGLHASIVRDADGTAIHSLGQVEDISARRQAEAELSHRALHDGLTGLPNRQLFMDRLDHALAQRPRGEEHVAVLFVDVDDLKAINDSYGHPAGDAVIRQVARQLEGALRPGDTIARLAGDEFTVLCPDVPHAEAAVQLAGRLLVALQTPVDAEGHRVAVRASVGVAVGDPGADLPAETLLAMADDALLRAKELGKDRVQLFDDRMRERARVRRHSAADLRRALDRDELRLHYQPVIHLPSGAIWAAETLVRWQHPERGLLPPGEFIPLAERLGLIVDVGRWVVGRACRESASWPRDHRGERLRLSINLSSRELAEPDLTDRLVEAIEAGGGEPRRLTFEITETSIVDEPAAALRTMRALQGLGAHVAIDDFGKGHSSLAQLKTFPVDVLKLDRLFVRGIEGSERDQALIDAVISMARALGVHLVVEGIEHQAQLDALAALGCQWGQGFHFARPMPAADLGAMLASAKNVA
jgi:diguanylate cyclase (GGDEF)-like protein/PAS domain S-box-containing protein